MRTMALCANALISLMARGARFLKVTPCSCSHVRQHSFEVPLIKALIRNILSRLILRGGKSGTYPLVHVNGVLASDHVGDGRTALLAGLLGGRHFCKLTALR